MNTPQPDPQVSEEQGTALIAAETLDNKRIAAIFGDGQTERIIELVRQHVAAAPVVDSATPQGRAELKSLAYRITRTKTLLDDAGKRYAEDLKKRVKGIDGHRKTLRDKLDELRDEVRRPVTEYEAEQAKRAAEIEERIAAIRDKAAPPGHEWTVAAAEEQLAALQAIEITEALFGARAGEAAMQKDLARTSLERALAAARKRNQELAELARLREAAAEQERRDAIAKAEREAAEQAHREAEQKAERERYEREREARERVEAAERAQRKAEEEARQVREKAEREAREREEAARREAEEEKRRAADREHRKAVNAKAVAALVEWGLSTEQAETAITVISAGQVPAVSIRY